VRFALQISEELKGTDVRVIRRVAEGEGKHLTRVRTLLWLVTFAALLAAAFGGGSFGGGIGDREAHGDWAHEGAGCELGTWLGCCWPQNSCCWRLWRRIGYALGIVLARLLGERIFGFAPAPKLFVLLIILGLAAVITLLGSAFPLRGFALRSGADLRGE